MNFVLSHKCKTLILTEPLGKYTEYNVDSQIFTTCHADLTLILNVHAVSVSRSAFTIDVTPRFARAPLTIPHGK